MENGSATGTGRDGLFCRGASDIAGEFRIGRTRCLVLSEEHLHQLLAGQARGADGPAPFTHVVGSCLVRGQRYLIVADDGADGELQESEHSAVELLTRRELQVALMVCEGLINKQIADRLGLSRWTIESYIRRACNKLGARNRAALVARLISDISPTGGADGAVD